MAAKCLRVSNRVPLVQYVLLNIDVYSLSYGCLLLFFGRVGDIVGARTLFLVGSAWFSVW